MKQHFTNENGAWTEENFTVGETYGNGRVLVIERGETQSNDETRVVFQCTETGKTEVAWTGYMSVFWTSDNNRYETAGLSVVGGLIKSNQPDVFRPTRTVR